jgi:hypothetical protein
LPSGVTAIANGEPAVLIALPTVLVAVLIGMTLRPRPVAMKRSGRPG